MANVHGFRDPNDNNNQGGMNNIREPMMAGADDAL